MPKADMHVHSHYSPDVDKTAGNTIEAIAKQAISKGLSAIAITDHYDIDMEKGLNCDLSVMIKEVLKEKETFADMGLDILLGIELGQANQFPTEEKKIRESANFDFILGSLHMIENAEDFYGIEYDKHSDHEIKELFECYLKELYVISDRFDFDSLAHCTYPIRYFNLNNRQAFLLSDYDDHYDTIFRRLIERGKALEINTSGFRQKLGTSFPPVSLIERYYKLGGELLTIGSDAHRLQDIGGGIDDMCIILKQIGFKYISIYKNREPIFIKI